MSAVGDKIIVEPGSEQRAGQRIAVEDLRAPVVKDVYKHWVDLKGTRSFPAREQITPRAMARLLRNIVLLRVIGEGEDFEYRIAGDAHTQAHTYSFSNLRISQVDAMAPGYGSAVMRAYRGVYKRRAPLALRGWIERHGGGLSAKIIFHESIMLPLGPTDDVVDHLLVGSVYANTWSYDEA